MTDIFEPDIPLEQLPIQLFLPEIREERLRSHRRARRSAGDRKDFFRESVALFGGLELELLAAQLRGCTALSLKDEPFAAMTRRAANDA